MDPLRHTFELTLPFDEFRIWGQRIKPVLVDAGIEAPCLDVLEYVCTEMLNNALDHSMGSSLEVAFDWDPRTVLMHITDNGRGAFGAIRAAMQLDSDADSALQILKGKVTSDPSRHTGEGLFFSSRACEWFNLHAGCIGLSLSQQQGHWAYETRVEDLAGTRLRFAVSRRDAPRLTEIFDRFCPQPELRFTRTEVSVGLLQQTDGALVSRSQGKRLVRGLDSFSAVNFDFGGVSSMQQGFADEVFRVWAQQHPALKISVSGADEGVARMLTHVGFTA